MKYQYIPKLFHIFVFMQYATCVYNKAVKKELFSGCVDIEVGIMDLMSDASQPRETYLCSRANAGICLHIVYIVHRTSTSNDWLFLAPYSVKCVFQLMEGMVES